MKQNEITDPLFNHPLFKDENFYIWYKRMWGIIHHSTRIFDNILSDEMRIIKNSYRAKTRFSPKDWHDMYYAEGVTPMQALLLDLKQ